jgi:hypothetical protein
MLTGKRHTSTPQYKAKELCKLKLMGSTILKIKLVEPAQIFALAGRNG